MRALVHNIVKEANMLKKRFQRTKDIMHSKAFWRQFAVVLLLFVLIGFTLSFVRQIFNWAVSFWRMMLFDYVPILRDIRDSGLEVIFAVLLALISTGVVAWVWLFYRNHSQEAVTGKLRRLQPVLVRHAPSRWQIGFRLSTNEVQLGKSADSDVVFMDPIYMPSFPLPATGQMEFIARDAYALIHNPWDEIALFIARGGISKVLWITTDTEGSPIKPEQLVSRATPLIQRDPVLTKEQKERALNLLSELLEL